MVTLLSLSATERVQENTNKQTNKPFKNNTEERYFGRFLSSYFMYTKDPNQELRLDKSQITVIAMVMASRYSSTNAVCPKYKRETEGGRSFAVSATRLWNSTPIEIRKLNSVACFKKNMFAKIFKEQQFLHHFII